MGLARELARKALLSTLTDARSIDEAIEAAVAAKAASGETSESVLRKSSSHARALVSFGRVAGAPVLEAAGRLLAGGGDEDALRRLLLQVNLQDALSVRSALNAERAHHQSQPSLGEAFYAALGHAAEALPSSPAEFAMALVNASPDCIKILSLDGRLLFMSENGRCAMQIDDFATVTGAFWAGFWPSDERPKLEHALLRARAGHGSRFSGTCPTARGERRLWDVLVSPIRGSTGEMTAILAVSRDVTTAAAIEARFAKSEAACPI